MSIMIPVSEIVDKSTSPLLSKHESWARVSLKEVGRVLNGFIFDSGNLSKEKGISLIRTRDILNDFTDWKYDGEFTDVYLIKPGDLLVSRYGDFNCALWKGPVGLLSYGVCKIEVSQELFISKFLFYLLPGYLKEIKDVTSSIAVENLSSKWVEEIPLPLPPLSEQQRIVSAIEQQFSRLDAEVAALQQAKEKLKRYRATVLEAAVEGKLTETWRAEHPTTEPASRLLGRILAGHRTKWGTDLMAKGKDPAKERNVEPKEPDVENLPESPEGWCWATLGQIAAFQNGKRFLSREYVSKGLKLLRAGNLSADGTIRWTEANTKYLPEARANRSLDFIIYGSELVMNLTAWSLKDEFLGRVCITAKDEKCLLNHRLARITPLEGIDRLYVFYTLKSSIFRRFVDGLKIESLNKHLLTSQLAEFYCPLPPLAEQEQIVSEVERRLSIVSEQEATVEANLKRAARLRRSILEEAFTGRLVPQDPNDEPASVLLERIRGERNGRKNGKVERKAVKNVMLEEPVNLDVEGMQQAGLWEGVGG